VPYHICGTVTSFFDLCLLHPFTILLIHGASLEIEDKDGMTALSLVEEFLSLYAN
jgi:hypothetical protein